MVDLNKISAVIMALTAASLTMGNQSVVQVVRNDNPAPVQFYAASVVELASSHNGHYIANASINNRSVNVLVDTGATSVALTFEDARRAGLQPDFLKFNIPVSTANGLAKAARVKLSRVEVQNILIRDVDGLVMPKDALNKTLLGMSFLSRLRGFKVRNGRMVMEN